MSFAAKFLFLALLYILLAACGVSSEQLNATDSVPEATTQTTSPTLTPTITPSPSPTATPSPLPTETLVPTPTSEPLPTTCLDPEVNERVKEDFLQESGDPSLEEALSNVEQSDRYAGLENGPSWYVFSYLKVLGGYRISLAGYSGFSEGDFANCLITAHPKLGETLVPMIIGIQRRNEWSQTASIAEIGSNPSIPGPEINLFRPGDVDSWIEEIRGEVILPLVVVRFDQPNWERDPLWHLGYDHVLPLLRREEGYIMRYTRDPSLLGESRSMPDGSGRPWGEPTSLSKVIPELNLEPGGDIGLFVFYLTLFPEPPE